MKTYNFIYNIDRDALISRLASLLPLFIPIVIIAGLAMSLVINRLDYAIRGLIIAIPALLASKYLHKSFEIDLDFKESIIVYPFKQKKLTLIYFILFNLSIIILSLFPIRNWYYIAIISLLYSIIFIQIFSYSFNVNFILCEIVLVLLNSIYSVTQKTPLYFGGTDIPSHLFMSSVTNLSGHVIPVDLSLLYTYFPLFHILISESSYLLGLTITSSFFLIAAPIYIVSVVFVYYILKSVDVPPQLSLLSTFAFSSTNTVLYHGTYMISRTIAFIGFLILIYTIYRRKSRDKKHLYSILSILFSIFILIVHQVSLPQIIMVLCLLLLCEKLIFNKCYFPKNFIILLSTLFLSYWLYISYLFTKSIVEARLKSQYYDTLIIKPTIHVGNQWSYILEHLDVPIFLFFALVGIGYVLCKRGNNYYKVFSLFSLLSLILYVPNPIQMLWQTMDLFRFDRFMLLITPFMSFAMATGIVVYLKYLLSHGVSNKKIMSIYLVILIFVFVSFVYSAPESDISFSKYPKTYFTSGELTGFGYIFENVPYGSSLYSDYYTSRFFIQNKFSLSEKLNLPFYNNYAVKNINEISAYKGYFLMRNNDYNKSGLVFSSNGYYVYNSSIPNQIEIYSILNNDNKIYSSSELSVYHNI